MALSDRHRLVCHLQHSLVCGRQVLPKTQVSLTKLTLASRKCGFSERARARLSFPSVQQHVLSFLSSVVIGKLRKTNSRGGDFVGLCVSMRARGYVTTDACSVSLLIRVHASF